MPIGKEINNVYARDLNAPTLIGSEFNPAILATDHITKTQRNAARIADKIDFMLVSSQWVVVALHGAKK
jgi:hypothetical protein